jgi:hypothetical protein
MNLLAPIFLYAGWRTGGTTLAVSFKNLDSTLMFYDPLNPNLAHMEYSQEIDKRKWLQCMVLTNYPQVYFLSEQHR